MVLNESFLFFLSVSFLLDRQRVGMTGAEKRTKAMEDEGGGGVFFFARAKVL